MEKKGAPTGIYLIGQESMEEELREEGLTWRGGTVRSALLPIGRHESRTFFCQGEEPGPVSSLQR